jgi:hypothetical protein
MSRQISSNLTDKNFKKVKDHQDKLKEKAKGTIRFQDALNDLLENIK